MEKKWLWINNSAGILSKKNKFQVLYKITSKVKNTNYIHNYFINEWNPENLHQIFHL